MKLKPDYKSKPYIECYISLFSKEYGFNFFLPYYLNALLFAWSVKRRQDSKDNYEKLIKLGINANLATLIEFNIFNYIRCEAVIMSGLNIVKHNWDDNEYPKVKSDSEKLDDLTKKVDRIEKEVTISDEDIEKMSGLSSIRSYKQNNKE